VHALQLPILQSISMTRPAETPEAWLLAKEHADSSSSSSSKPGRRNKKLRVPYLGLEVTPELVAISMGECSCWHLLYVAVTAFQLITQQWAWPSCRSLLASFS
jgi:hypothetical protein